MLMRIIINRFGVPNLHIKEIKLLAYLSF